MRHQNYCLDLLSPPDAFYEQNGTEAAAEDGSKIHDYFHRNCSPVMRTRKPKWDNRPKAISTDAPNSLPFGKGHGRKRPSRSFEPP